MQVVQVVLWYLDSGCSKHMTGNRSKLKNFVEKFIGTVRFGNDHFGAIMGYGDYVIGNVWISEEYLYGSPWDTICSCRANCDSGSEIISESILAFEDLGKLQAKADIGIFVGYAPNRKGFRIYNKRTRRIMETIHVTFDELLQTIAPVHIGSGPEPMSMTPGNSVSGLIPNHVMQQLLVDAPYSSTAVNAHVVPQGTSVTTTFAQDAPSTSFSPSSSRIQPPVIQHDVAIGPTNEDTPITQATLHPSNNPVTGEPGSK
ncbi:hypothetical protein Tco_1153113 [Tanacetum coccineum]